MSETRSRPRYGETAVWAWTLLLTGILLWPQHRWGYGLGRDMVFTPHQPLNLASLGVSSASPRAVPVDALIALSEHLINGAILGRLALVVPLVAAGVGTARLLSPTTTAGALAASGLAIWNPFVIERLALGQWALLWAYGFLPFVIRAAVQIGKGERSALWLIGPLAACSITPTGGVIGSVLAITTAAWGAKAHRSYRQVGIAAVTAAALQLPWVVASVVSTASGTSDPGAVAAFASRAEHPGGVLLSLLGLGGIWDADVTPGSRGGPLAWLGLALIGASTLYGWRWLMRRAGPQTVGPLAVCAVLGLALALASSLPGIDTVVAWLVAHVPGAGLFRDAQKWLMPLATIESLLFGAAVDRIAAGATARARPWRPTITVVALAIPLILLPDAAATLRPTLSPVRYPSDWASVRQLIRAGPSGDTIVLPFWSYRVFDWAPGRSTYDPAPSLLPGTTIVDDRLAVSGTVIAGEDPRAAQIRGALNSSDLAAALAPIGIRWVVVERRTPGVTPELSSLRPTYSGKDVSLFQVPGAVHQQKAGTSRIVLGVGALISWLLLVAVWFTASAVARRRLTEHGQPVFHPVTDR